MGISNNTNECINMADGDYIALFDHDDLLHPSALFEMMKAICYENADFVYTDEVTFTGNNPSNITIYNYSRSLSKHQPLLHFYTIYDFPHRYGTPFPFMP